MMIIHHIMLISAALVVFLLAPVLVSSDDSVDPKIKQFVKDVNDLRREMAKNYSVPNMHQLLWSDELANSSAHWTSPGIGNNEFYLTKMKSFEIRTLLPQEMEKYVKMDTKAKWMYITNSWKADKFIDFLIPLQTFIACSSDFCATGPHKFTRKMFDVSGESKGVPGSMCGAKFEDVDGLCVAKQPEKMSYFHGDPLEFVEDVNSVRRIMAKRYKVANMHELVWDESLKVTANGLNMYSKLPDRESNDANWRFLTVVYPGIVEVLMADVEWNVELSEDERNSKFLYFAKYNRSVALLELLNSQQKRIGCVYGGVNGSFYNLCVLGNSRELELWDFEAKSTSEPGSNCSAGYVNYDGLCSIPTTTSTTTTTTITTTSTKAPTTMTTTTEAPTTAAPTTKAPAPKTPPPTHRPVPTPAKQTSDGKDKDSAEFEDVLIFDEEISSSSRVSFGLAISVLWVLVF